MTPYALARELILSRVQTLPAERVALELAAGRSLAEDLVARAALPAFDNSAMDGYALRAADLATASAQKPVALRVTARLTAGDVADGTLQPGQAARIMTGAPLPPGADAVVMQEEVQRDGELATFTAPVEVGEHVRRAGEDIDVGAVAVRAGVALGASELALLASLGHTQLFVHRRPRVALISTGDELVNLGASAPGKLVDSNAVGLAVRLRQLGAEVVNLGVAGDSPEALRARFLAARGCDVVCSTAGVSVGEKDHVKQVLTGLGATLLLEKVAIRPGKPLAFAASESALYFGLPGNPVSARVTFEVFVAPALRKLLGDARPQPLLPARLAVDWPKVEALTFFTRVRLERDAQGLVAVPMAKQGSNALTSLVGADGLAILPAGSARVAQGTLVEVLPLGG